MRRRERGFVLIETLVAFTILVIVLLTVGQAVGGGVRQARIVDEASGRALAARSILDRVGVDIPLAAGDHQGVTSDGHRWAVRVTPLEAEGAVPRRRFQLFELHVVVAGPSDDRRLDLKTRRIGSVL